ncbi:MAG: lipopolysaccharide biosynthesis protein, partial [Novipirellula sp. JB048]
MKSPVLFRKFLKSSSSAFVMRASAAVAAFLMNVVVTRTLGAYEAGLFFLAQTCLVILSTLSRFGLDNAVLRFVSVSMDLGNRGAANAVLGKALALALPIASATSLITFIAADWIAESVFSKPEFADALRLVGLCVLPFSCFQLVSFALQGRNQVTLSIAINATIFPL